MGLEVNTASFALYTFSMSVLVQSLVIISMSGAADHGVYRKSLLLSFAFTGAVATMLFIAVIPKVYLFGALLAIISNTCFGASFVLLNSFLPLLVRHHPSVQSSASSDRSPLEDYQEDTDSGAVTDAENLDQESSTEALLGPLHGDRTRTPSTSAASNQQFGVVSGRHSARLSERQILKASASPELRLSTKISSYGIGIGYIAGVVVQLLAIGIIILISLISESTNLAFRIVLLFIGLWWFGFTIPAALWLRPRPGPPIPFANKSTRRGNWLGYVSYAWRSLGKTILRAGRLRDVLLFLASWFMISDSIATVSGTAILFAKTEMKMKVMPVNISCLEGS